MGNKKDKDVPTLLECKFAAEYVANGGNGIKAVKKNSPGYADKPASSRAANLLKKNRVKAEIARLMAEVEKNAIMKADEAERILDSIIRANPKDYVTEIGAPKPLKDLTREQAWAIEELTAFTSERDGGSAVVLGTTVKLLNKLKSLDQKWKLLGRYKQTLVFEDPYMKYLAEIERQRLQQEKPG
jgi:phage terminase small subunit